MPKASPEALQTLLAPYGLRLTVANGKLGIIEGVGSGLPVKKATLVFVAKMKPDGSVGRGGKEGYNFQAEMELSDDHYKVLRNIGAFILSHTQSINTEKCMRDQPPGSIELCVRKLLKVHPELDAFKPFGYWALRATFQLLLRNKSGQANWTAVKLKKAAELIESGGVPPMPAVRPRKPRGRPRKNPVWAPEGTTTTANEPAVPIQPPLEPEPVAAALHNDEGEVFDLNVEDADSMDVSICQAIRDMSGISLNADDLGDDKDDDDDNGSFDMAQVLTFPASAPAPRGAPIPTVPSTPLALPVSVHPGSVSSAPTASVALSAPPVSLSSAAPVSVSPVPAASATPPVPPANSPDSAPAAIIWRGLTISPAQMTTLKNTLFVGLLAERIDLIEDPNYDPSSEPDPVPQVASKKAAAKPKPKAKAASMSEPGLEPNRDAGKGKGKAAVEATEAPARRSGRESKQTKR